MHAVRAGNVAVANALGSGTRRDAGACSRSCRGSVASSSAKSCSCRAFPRGGAATRSRAAYVLDHLERPRRSRRRRRVRRVRAHLRRQPDLGRASDAPRRASSRDRSNSSRRSAWSCRRRPSGSVTRFEPRHVAIRAYRHPFAARLRSHARRPDARIGDGEFARRLDAARRRQQGSLDARRRRGGEPGHAAPVPGASGGDAAERRRFAEPRGGQPVLARSLPGARREARFACCARCSRASRANPRRDCRPMSAALVRAIEVTSELELGLTLCAHAPHRNRVGSCRALFFAEEPPHALRATLMAAHRAGLGRSRSAVGRHLARGERLPAARDGRGEPRRRPSSLSDAFDFIGQLVLLFSAFSGLSHENMTHGPGWRFADMGRRIERVHHTARLLRTILVQADAGRRPDARSAARGGRQRHHVPDALHRHAPGSARSSICS